MRISVFEVWEGRGYAAVRGGALQITAKNKQKRLSSERCVFLKMFLMSPWGGVTGWDLGISTRRCMLKSPNPSPLRLPKVTVKKKVKVKTK